MRRLAYTLRFKLEDTRIGRRTIDFLSYELPDLAECFALDVLNRADGDHGPSRLMKPIARRLLRWSYGR